MRKDILEQKDLILEMISRNEPKQQICRVLNCKPDTLERYLKKMDIVYAGNQCRKGFPQPESYKPVQNYLYNGSTIQSYKLKNKLIKENIFEEKCSECNLEMWQGVKIPLELDHIDGQPFNNELSNLRLLCPNCHALTDTYRAKNKRSMRNK